MGLHGARASPGAATAPDDHRLLLGALAQEFEKAAAGADTFEVHRDRGGLRVVEEVLEVVGLVEDGGVADGDGAGDGDAEALCADGDADAVRAGLGDDGDRAALALLLGGGELHAESAVVDAHAVGADERQVGLVGHGDDLGLEFDADRLSGLDEPRREHRDAADLLLHGVRDDERRDVARDGADDEVNLARDLHQAAEVLDPLGLDAGGLFLVELDGVEVAGELGAVGDPLEVRALVTDDHDGLRVEGAVESGAVDGHRGPLRCWGYALARTMRASTASAPSG